MATLLASLDEEANELVAEYEAKRRVQRRASAGGALRSGSPAIPPAVPLSTSRTTQAPLPQELDASRHHRTRSDASALAARPSRASLESEGPAQGAQPIGQSWRQAFQQPELEGSLDGARLSSEHQHSQEKARHHSTAGILEGTHQHPSLPRLAPSSPPGQAPRSWAAVGGSRSPLPTPTLPVVGSHAQKGGTDDDDMADEEDNDLDVEESEDPGSGEEGVSSKSYRGRASTTEGGSVEGARKKKFGSVIKNRGLSPYRGRTSTDPAITLTGPEGDHSERAYPYPNTSYEDGYAVVSPQQSDAEDDDVQRAQKLAILQSPVMTTAASHRTMLTLIRGNFRKMQLEAESGLRRQRIYVNASDLSPEAAYALEWTIGVCLRDGDTLLAVFAMPREGLGTSTESGGVAIGQGADVMEDSNKMVAGISDVQFTDQLNLSPLGASSKHGNDPDASSMTEAERERYNAAVAIAAKCVGLLRRTRLQVRVVVEVFHCESPKHMLTEVVSVNAEDR